MIIPIINIVLRLFDGLEGVKRRYFCDSLSLIEKLSKKDF